MRVYVHHITDADLCRRGARAWFSSYGLSWNDFLSNGIEFEKLQSLNDALADRVIEAARKEQALGE